MACQLLGCEAIPAELLSKLIRDDDSDFSDEDVSECCKVDGGDLIMTRGARSRRAQSTDFGHPVHKIKRGFAHFKRREFNKYPEYYDALAEGQSPKFLVFACSDSRVSPVSILNLRPGEAFMARNIANLVPAFDKVKFSGTGAIIEYAVAVLKVETILVVGHSRCGGIKALMTYPYDKAHSPYDFIHEWMGIGLPAKAKVISENGDKPLEEQIKICENEAVNLSLVNLLTYPYVRAGVTKKTLNLMGGCYDFVGSKFKMWELDMSVKHLLPQ